MKNINFISTKEASAKWGISERRIQKLCEQGRIEDVIRFGRSWALPINAQKPADKRFKNNKSS